MFSFALSCRERAFLTSLGVLLLIPGLAFAVFARPCPLVITCSLLALGVLLPLIGAVGRFRTPAAAEADREIIAEPDQAVTHVSIGDVSYPRVRCGSETETKGEMDFCSDCFTRAGQYHAIGCDLEECPKCRRQMISCGCSIAELGGDQ